MEFDQKFFHEIDLFDFTNFFGLDFFKFSGPVYQLARVHLDKNGKNQCEVQGPRNDFYLGGPPNMKNNILRIFENFTIKIPNSRFFFFTPQTPSKLLRSKNCQKMLILPFEQVLHFFFAFQPTVCYGENLSYNNLMITIYHASKNINVNMESYLKSYS